MITITQALASASVVAEEIDPDSQEALIDNALPIAGLFVLVLGVAMFFLWRSMSKQMRRIDPTLPDGPDDREQAADRALTEEAVERGAEADQDDAAR